MKPNPLPGVHTLATWLAEHDTTPHAFALQIGWDPQGFRHLLKGDLTRVSVELAAKIEDGTNGDVAMRLWVPVR